MKNLDKINEKYGEVKNVCNKFVDIQNEMQKQCVEFLKSLVDSNGGEIVGDLLEGVYVAYDGGNHPEYATTMASNVERIYVEDGTLYFDIEDETQYSFDRVMVNDLIWVCEDIMNNLKNIEEDE